MLTPAGRVSADHVTVPILPETVNVTSGLIAEPTSTDTVDLDGVIVNGGTGASLTVMLTVAVAALPAVSVAATLTL